MARIRTVKPGFWDSEQIGECSTNARLLFIGIWNFADDRGVIEERPKQIKGQLFRFDDFSVGDVQTWIGELLRADLLRRFTAEDGKTYLYVPTWEKHQKVDKPQLQNANPAPPKFDEHSANEQPELPYDSPNVRRPFATDRKGKDRKGEERKREEGKGVQREGKPRGTEGRPVGVNGVAPEPPLTPSSRLGRAAQPPDRLQEITSTVLARYGPERGFEMLAAYEAGDPETVATIDALAKEET
jgi:hypothetical protein